MTYTQVVFDVLRASEEFLPLAEIIARGKIDEDRVNNALQALRDRRVLVSVRYQDRQWRYGVQQWAERPHDARGRRKQTA